MRDQLTINLTREDTREIGKTFILAQMLTGTPVFTVTPEDLASLTEEFGTQMIAQLTLFPADFNHAIDLNKADASALLTLLLDTIKFTDDDNLAKLGIKICNQLEAELDGAQK